MLVGVHSTASCLLNMSSIRLVQHFCRFKKSKFLFRKTSRWKFFDIKLARFVERISAPVKNNRSTAAELGKSMCGFLCQIPKQLPKTSFFPPWNLQYCVLGKSLSYFRSSKNLLLEKNAQSKYSCAL